MQQRATLAKGMLGNGVHKCAFDSVHPMAYQRCNACHARIGLSLDQPNARPVGCKEIWKKGVEEEEPL